MSWGHNAYGPSGIRKDLPKKPNEHFRPTKSFGEKINRNYKANRLELGNGNILNGHQSNEVVVSPHSAAHWCFACEDKSPFDWVIVSSRHIYFRSFIYCFYYTFFTLRECKSDADLLPKNGNCAAFSPKTVLGLPSLEPHTVARSITIIFLVKTHLIQWHAIHLNTSKYLCHTLKSDVVFFLLCCWT